MSLAVWLRVLAASTVIGACVLAALHDAPRRAIAKASRGVEPVRVSGCPVPAAHAAAQAAAFEQLAQYHWQRAPFAHEAALRATQQVARAEACYRSLGDRVGAARAATLQRRYVAETMRQRRVGQGGAP